MPEILLRGNSPLFATDLRQMGYLFFPGEEIGVAVPPDLSAPGATDPLWLIEAEALPLLESAQWQVRVTARGPAGSRQAQERLAVTGLESPRTLEHKIRRQAISLLVDIMADLRGFQPGWGHLTGVRPTKLIHQLLDAGVADPAAALMREFRVTPQKARLVERIARLQRPFLHRDPRAISVYVGIPFCPSICSFCSFSIYPILEHKAEVPLFLEALGREMAIVGQAITDLGLRVESIYFGGGTPTSPRDEDFIWMLQRTAETLLKGQEPAEYTMEGGRPETFTRAKLDAMAHHGVSRVSVNPQTTVQATLMHLGRIHTVEKFYRAYDLVRQHPYPFIVNCDTIIGLPGEGPEEVTHTLEDMRRLAPDNLTVHTLAIKRGSRLHREEAAAAGALRALGPAEAEALVAQAASTAAAMGQHPYYLYRQKFMVGSLENVGYSLPGKESLYNIQMMEERQSVVGLGGGATSKWYKPLGGNRGWLLKGPENANEPGAYIARVEEMAQRKADALRLIFGQEAPAPDPSLTPP